MVPFLFAVVLFFYGASLLGIMYFFASLRENSPIISFLIAVPIIAFVILNIAAYRVPSEQIVLERYSDPILSLETGSSVSGSFFLGIGKVNDTNYYYAYEETDRGMQLTRYRVNAVYLRETTEQPRITRYTEIKQTLSGNIIFDAILFGSSNEFTVLYIPEGSVIKEYNPHQP